MDHGMPASQVDSSTLQGERIEAVCREFEDAWSTARSPAEWPSIEHYLPDGRSSEWSALLAELMMLDVELRSRQGGTPDRGVRVAISGGFRGGRPGVCMARASRRFPGPGSIGRNKRVRWEERWDRERRSLFRRSEDRTLYRYASAWPGRIRGGLSGRRRRSWPVGCHQGSWSRPVRLAESDGAVLRRGPHHRQARTRGDRGRP